MRVWGLGIALLLGVAVGQVRELGGPGTKAVVLFYVASDCPISNRTFPEMKRLREAYSGRGVRFWFVYPNTTETAAGVREHQREFDAGGMAVLDTRGALVAMGKAFVTPEVSVLVPDGGGWRAVYTGRVDDRFVRIGQERPAPTVLLADRALGEVLAGKVVEQDPGVAVGCTIMGARR